MIKHEWILINTERLGGQPYIKGTRLSVSFILKCLSQGMTSEEIAKDYPGFPPECVPDVLSFAAQEIDNKSREQGRVVA